MHNYTPVLQLVEFIFIYCRELFADYCQIHQINVVKEKRSLELGLSGRLNKVPWTVPELKNGS